MRLKDLLTAKTKPKAVALDLVLGTFLALACVEPYWMELMGLGMCLALCIEEGKEGRR